MQLNLKKHLNVALFVALLALAANITVPFGLIPFTLQTFALDLLALVLSPYQALSATLLYLFLGLIGLPVFAGFSSGIAVFLSPSAGFLIGFPVAAVCTSFLKTKIPKILAIVIGMVVLFTIGTVVLIMITKMDLLKALNVAVVPFILPEVLKITLALVVYSRLKKYIIKE